MTGRALLSAVGTRGDVQPIVALAVALRESGYEARLAVPPNFVDWVRGLGFEAQPVGVEMRARPASKGAPPLTAKELKRLQASMPDLITDQFESVGAAAEGCQVILGANAHQYAARSIAEKLRLPYVTALYAPVAIPSNAHAPAPAPGQPWISGGSESNARLWTETLRAWNDRALERVNQNRARLGLSPIADVLSFNVTDSPWLAADDALGPAPSSAVFETGAWILRDVSPLAPEVEAFLAAGAAPLYLGFGSMPTPPGAGRVLVQAARAVGRRAIVSQGWAEWAPVDEASDWLSVRDVNQQALFPRVAAVVHHGGAGTTAAAARAGVPQVVAPLFGDQFYWASRVRALGLGSALDGPLAVESLTAGLSEALKPEVAERAKRFTAELRNDGASVAAQRLMALRPGD